MIASAKTPIQTPEHLETSAQSLLEASLDQEVQLVSLDMSEDRRLRLLELGLCPGTPITPKRRAPFGGPVEVEIWGLVVVNSQRRRPADALRYRSREGSWRSAPRTTNDIVSQTRPPHKSPHPQPRKPQVALIGTPNCGKSMLFTRLTGMSQRVINYPGSTVEQKIGQASLPARSQQVRAMRCTRHRPRRLTGDLQPASSFARRGDHQRGAQWRRSARGADLRCRCHESGAHPVYRQRSHRNRHTGSHRGQLYRHA